MIQEEEDSNVMDISLLNGNYEVLNIGQLYILSRLSLPQLNASQLIGDNFPYG